MEGTAMQNVLRSMGWGDGFHVPVANTENKELESQVEALLLRKAKASSECETSSNRFATLKNHLECVKQESQQNQIMLTAYRQELDRDNHKIRLLSMEKDGNNQEMRQLSKTFEDVTKRCDDKRGDLSKALKKMEKLKAEAAWDAEAIEAWETSLKKRDEDNELLKKFSKEDEKRLNVFEAKRKSIQSEVNSKKQLVETMCADILNYEAILFRTGKMLQKSKIERAALVQQWQEAVKNMRQRDQDINRANRDLDNIQQLIMRKREVLAEQDSFLENQKNNNHAIEFEISESNNVSSRLRKNLMDIIDSASLLSGEVGAQKRTIIGAHHSLRKEQALAKSIDADIENKREQINIYGDQILKLKETLANVKSKTLSAADRAKKFETMIDEGQRMMHAFSLDIEKQMGVLFRSQQLCSELTESGKLQLAEINGSDVSMSMMERRSKQQYQEFVKATQVLVDLSMQAETLDAQLQFIETGFRDSSNNSTSYLELNDLEAILAEHTEIYKLLSGQVFRLQKEMRRLVAAIGKATPVRFALLSKLNELTLMVEGGKKHAAMAKLELQQRQVDENVLRLRVDQLNKAMTKEDKNIYDLQTYRLNLETAMKARQIEISTNNDILLAKRRNMDEERSRLKADVAVRNVKVKHMQTKYDVAISLLGTDDAGEPLSVTHFKIKNAQDKYLLQKQGDELEEKIRKTEDEIVAMENTLKIVDQSNNRFKNSLALIDEKGDEATELMELEHTLVETTGKVQELKRKYLDLQDDLAKNEANLKEAETIRLETKETVKQQRDSLIHLEVEEEERQNKIDRAMRHLKSYVNKIPDEKLLKYDQDLHIRQFQDAYKAVISQLIDLYHMHEETCPNIDYYMNEHHLTLPQPKSNISTVSSDSVRSITNSMSSRSGNCSSSSAIIASVDLQFPMEEASGPIKGSRPIKKSKDKQKRRSSDNIKFRI